MRIYLLIIYLFFDSIAWGQTANTGQFWKCPFEYNLVKISKGGYYGLTDRNGKEILPVKYDEIEYKDSLIVGKINGIQYGYDSTGREINIKAYGYESPEKVGVYIPELGRYVSRNEYSEGLMVINEQFGFYWKNRIAYVDRFLKIQLGFLKYSKGRNFSEGLASVYYRGYWGFIDKKGNEVVKPQFDFCWDFKEGLALVEKDSLVGYINQKGEMVIPMIYTVAGNFCNGIAKVKIKDEYFLIDKKGEKITSIVADTWSCEENRKYSCPNPTGLYYHEGLSQFEENGKWGYVDRLNNIVVPVVYDAARDFVYGQAIVIVDGKKGVIDKNGNEILPPKYLNEIDFIKNFLRIVADSNKLGLVNWQGEYVLPVEYDGIYTHYRAGDYLICEKNGKKGICNDSGRLIIPVKFNDIRLLDNNYFVCQIAEKHHAVYSKSGKYINEVKGEYVDIQSECIIFKTNGKYGFYHYKTNYFSPSKFSSINGFYRDTGIAYVGGAACHIDTKGNFITQPRFSHVETFSEGRAVVKSGSVYGFINTKGDLITPVMYEQAQRFSEGLALVKFKGKYGFIDTGGKIVIDFSYSEAGPFGDGLAAVKVGNYWGFIDQQGKMVIEPQFDRVMQAFTGGRTYVIKNNRMFIINPEGEEVSR